MHARRFRDFAGRAVDGAIGKHVGDIDAVKRRAGDKWDDFIGLRRCADIGG